MMTFYFRMSNFLLASSRLFSRRLCSRSIESIRTEKKKRSIKKKPFCETQLKYLKPDLRTLIDGESKNISLVSLVYTLHEVAFIRISKKIDDDRLYSYNIDDWALSNWSRGIESESNTEAFRREHREKAIRKTLFGLPKMDLADALIFEEQKSTEILKGMKNDYESTMRKKLLFELSGIIYSALMEKWMKDANGQGNLRIYQINLLLLKNAFFQTKIMKRQIYTEIIQQLPTGYPILRHKINPTSDDQPTQEKRTIVEFPESLKNYSNDDSKMEIKISNALNKAILQAVAFMALYDDLMELKKIKANNQILDSEKRKKR